MGPRRQLQRPSLIWGKIFCILLRNRIWCLTSWHVIVKFLEKKSCSDCLMKWGKTMNLQLRQLRQLTEGQSTAETDFIVHWRVDSTAGGTICWINQMRSQWHEHRLIQLLFALRVQFMFVTFNRRLGEAFRGCLKKCQAEVSLKRHDSSQVIICNEMGFGRWVLRYWGCSQGTPSWVAFKQGKYWIFNIWKF